MHKQRYLPVANTRFRAVQYYAHGPEEAAQPFGRSQLPQEHRQTLGCVIRQMCRRLHQQRWPQRSTRQ
jgi:hypothetical protein